MNSMNVFYCPNNKKQQPSLHIDWNPSDFQSSSNIENVNYLPEYSAEQLNKQSIESIMIAKKKYDCTKKQPNQSIDKYLNYPQRNDSFNSLFGNNQTILKLQNGILSQEQFIKAQGDNTPSQTSTFWFEKTQQKLYGKNKSEQQVMNWGLYYAKYLQWKQQPVRKSVHDNSAIFDKLNMKEDNSLTDIILERQLQRSQWETLKKEQHKKIEQQRMKTMNKQLGAISSEFKTKMSQLIEKSEYKFKRTAKQSEQIPQKKHKLDIEHISFPSFSTKVCHDEVSVLKTKNIPQIQHTSYVDLIRHPPKNNHLSSQIGDLIKKQSVSNLVDNDYMQYSQISGSSKISAYGANKDTIANKDGDKTKYLWKLNVQQLLKLPHRQFLIFYAENERKIMSLSTVDELKQLKQYRNQSLQRQQAIVSLKEKISKNGTQIVSRLSKDKKNKLFQLLYEDELNDEMVNEQKLQLLSRQGRQ